MREAEIVRETAETQIRLKIGLDGTGAYRGKVPVGFLDHMLHLLAHHGQLDLQIDAQGDMEVDEHHLVEDLGIVLGQALRAALGDKKGIERYGWSLLPMDEVLVAVALDLSGRFAFACNYRPVRDRVGDLSTEMVTHFFRSLAVEAGMNLHFHFLNQGENEHHRVEALFKGFGRALRMAAKINPSRPGIPSTKGRL